MEKWLGKYSNFFYALMRVIAGVLFACHGAQKLFGVLGGQKQEATLMIAAGIIEFGAGILIAVGLFTGYVAFIASGEMAVAYFKQHYPPFNSVTSFFQVLTHPGDAGFWPIVNHGELAVLFCFVFLYIASRGSGTLSVDALLAKARRR
jgi:putative oxidoreductase